MEAPQKLKIRGYLYILVQSFTLAIDKEVVGHISLGQTAKCVTKPHLSGKTVNQVFLIEVAQQSTRLSIDFKDGDKSLGECRYDIIPFFSHPSSTHSLNSDLNNNDQLKQGTVSFKLTYYSGQFGRLRVRVFSLEMAAAVVDHFKQARLKAKIGVYAQSSQEWDMKKPFDETLELLVLNKTNNLQFEVVHTEGVLAKFTIYDLQKSGLLIEQTKAYQVSLFNGDKAVGNIKYQIDWIH